MAGIPRSRQARAMRASLKFSAPDEERINSRVAEYRRGDIGQNPGDGLERHLGIQPVEQDSHFRRTAFLTQSPSGGADGFGGYAVEEKVNVSSRLDGFPQSDRLPVPKVLGVEQSHQHRRVDTISIRHTSS